MTQTSPKSAPHNTTNSHAQPINGLVESQSPATDHPLEANLISPPQPTVQATETIKPRIELEGVRQGILRDWWQVLSFRAKATAVAIALGTLPVLAVGATAYFLTNKKITEDVVHEQQIHVISLANNLDRFTIERYKDIEKLSQLSILNNPRVRAVTSAQEKKDLLQQHKDTEGYDSLAVADLAGNPIIKGDDGETPANFSKIDYFQAVIRTNIPFINPARKSVVTGQYSIILAAPVVDTQTGKTIGIVRSLTHVTQLNQILQLEAKQLEQNTKSFESPNELVLNDKGKVVLATEAKYLKHDAQSVFPKAAALLKTADKVSSVVDINQLDQKEYILSYAPAGNLQGLPGLKWGVMVAQPTAEVFAARQELQLTFAIGTLITALLVGAIAAYLASRAMRPILAATSAVEKLGQGELDTRITVQGKDEFAVLGSNINLMADQLQDLLQKQEAETNRSNLFTDIAASRARDFQDLRSVFNKALKEARETLNADRVVVYRFNADWSGYIASESVALGWPTALEEKINDLCIDQHILEAYRKGRVFLTNNVFEAGFAPEHMELLQRLEIKANLVTPILQNDQLYGLLIAHHCYEPHAWQQSEITFLTQLAAQLGLIVDRVTFIEQQRTGKEQLQKRALELLMEVDPISQGDLTIRVNVTEDEIGTIADAYNATIGSLREIVTQVQTAAKLVTASTSSSEASVQQLSAEALRQAHEITTVLDRTQEMSDSIRAVAANAEQASAAVKQSTQTVEAGEAAMNRTVAGMLAIRETVAETSKKVKRLGESSQKISKVVNLIGTFADKTNFLALNAAIEAANAGEQGRGFAVVADQVRALARQSAQATAEIEKLVTDIQTETNEVVAAMEAGTEQVVTGTNLVNETRQSLNQITAVSTQISGLVNAIASAAVEQSQTSFEVTQTMTDVAAIAQHTSNEATLVSASFKELLAVAQELQASAGQFKVS